MARQSTEFKCFKTEKCVKVSLILTWQPCFCKADQLRSSHSSSKSFPLCQFFSFLIFKLQSCPFQKKWRKNKYMFNFIIKKFTGYNVLLLWYRQTQNKNRYFFCWNQIFVRSVITECFQCATSNEEHTRDFFPGSPPA